MTNNENKSKKKTFTGKNWKRIYTHTHTMMALDILWCTLKQYVHIQDE